MMISLLNIYVGSLAQLVEQWTENPCVAGSIPARATFLKVEFFYQKTIKNLSKNYKGKMIVHSKKHSVIHSVSKSKILYVK